MTVLVRLRKSPLIRRLRIGELHYMIKQELEWCIREYGKDIYSFCRYLANNIEDADDLYQDTFLTAMEQFEKIDMQQNPKSYLLSVALRLWKNRKRKYAWRKRITDMILMREEAEDEEREAKVIRFSPEEVTLRREKIQAVRQAVSNLPERLRIIILLYYTEELSVSQISELVHIPEGTVKSRLFKARKVLEKELELLL